MDRKLTDDALEREADNIDRPNAENNSIGEVPPTINTPRTIAEALNHSKPLDVHTWSEHPEVNGFVNEIYEAHFLGGNEKIRKKHLKVVLLDLYVTWCCDPNLKIAVSLNPNN